MVQTWKGRDSVYLGGGFARKEEECCGRHPRIIMNNGPKAESQEAEQTQVHARPLPFYVCLTLHVKERPYFPHFLKLNPVTKPIFMTTQLISIDGLVTYGREI